MDDTAGSEAATAAQASMDVLTCTPVELAQFLRQHRFKVRVQGKIQPRLQRVEWYSRCRLVLYFSSQVFG